MGGISAAQNQNLLCRLNIEYIVDVSNVTWEDLPHNIRSDCPCLCSKETKHTQARMTIPVDECDTTDITVYFDQAWLSVQVDESVKVNEFIDKARQMQKCTLIHSYNGTNRAAVFACQYLIATHKCTSFAAALEMLRENSGRVVRNDG